MKKYLISKIINIVFRNKNNKTDINAKNTQSIEITQPIKSTSINGYLPWFSMHEDGWVRGQGMIKKLCLKGESIYDRLKKEYPNHDEIRWFKYSEDYERLIPCSKEEAQVENRGMIRGDGYF